MAASVSMAGSLLQTGSGFIFQTLFADLLAIGIIAVLITTVIGPRVKKMRSFRKVIKEIGSPKGHWLYGHAIKYGYTHQGLMNTVERCKEFPAMCSHFLGFAVAVHIYHPDLTKLVLSRSHPKSYFYIRFLKTALNDGLVTSSGALWKRHRRLLTPMFHFEILKEHAKIFNKNCQGFLDTCRKISDTGKAHDVTPSISNTTFNNMMECVMSRKAYDSSGKVASYVQGVRTMSAELMHRFTNLVLWTDFIYNRSKRGHLFKQAKATVHDEAAKIIKERRKVLEETTSGSDQTEFKTFLTEEAGKSFAFRKRKGKDIDFLDLLLQAKDDDGVGLSDNEINDEVITFFSAGQETVATGLSWTLYYLSTHQDYQKKCRQEIQDILGDKEEFDHSDLSQLQYCTQCIKESLRLKPPVHTIARNISSDVNVSCSLNDIKEVTLPKGTNIVINVFALHRNPHVWENPEVFDPERFNAENLCKIPAFAYIPFAAGPRNCIGQNFAMVQMKVFLAQVLRRYEFHYDPSIPAPKLSVGITIQPENGLPLIVKPVLS